MAGLLTLGTATVVEATTPSVPDAAQSDSNNDDDNSSKVGLFGLVGLLGLAGLAGLRRREDRTYVEPVTRTPRDTV